MKIFALLILTFFFSIALKAQTLSIGDQAPEIITSDENGDTWNSNDHLGKEFLVVYFYPAAMTGGCTKQACAYRDFKDEFSQLGATVVGISGDLPEGLKYFKNAYDLNFTLLSDFDGKIASAFGVTMKNGGTIQREIDGINVELTRGITSMRWTFVIDKNGKIVYIDTNVDASQDSQNTLSKIKALIAKS